MAIHHRCFEFNDTYTFPLPFPTTAAKYKESLSQELRSEPGVALARVGKPVRYAPPGSCKLSEMYRPLLVKKNHLSAPRRSSMVERQTSLAFLSLLRKVHSMGIPINWGRSNQSRRKERWSNNRVFNSMCRDPVILIQIH